MNTIAITTVIGLLMGAVTVAPAPAEESAWIIETAPSAVEAVTAAAEELSAEAAETLVDAFSGVAVDLTLAEAELLEARPDVIAVHPDTEMTLLDTQSSAPWHLSRLDQANAPADSTFTYSASAGAGVRVYIVDSGISPNAGQLGSRLLPGVSTVEGQPATTDCHGHGTHVAGIVASATWGVAKRASVVPVRVFACSGSTSSSTVIAGLNWIAANHPAGTPGVVNMSLGGSVSPALDGAVQKLVTAGFIVAVAGGNGGADAIGDDACTVSPARAPGALTVGATTSSDARAGYSNFGSCLDLFAPGSAVRSLKASDAAGSTTMSGTSMASPMVAGVAALAWGDAPSAPASQISGGIVRAGTVGAVSVAGAGSTTKLARLMAAVPPGGIQASAPSAPLELSVAQNDGAHLTVVWRAPLDEGDSAVTDYVILYRPTSSTTWRTVSDGIHTRTSFTFKTLSPSVTHTFRVKAKNATGTGAAATITATTASRVPAAPSPLLVTENNGTLLTLAWDAPTWAGTSPVVDYVILYRPTSSTTWRTVSDGIHTRTSFTFKTLSPSVTHTFRVKAKNATGTGAAATTSVTTSSR